MTAIVKVGILFLNCIYRLFWIFPIKNKVVFISRQSNSPSEDIQRLCVQIQKECPDCQVQVLCKMLGLGTIAKIKYCFHMLIQMYHIATAKVVVLDSYCIVASVLTHRKKLKIIQMWHAIGCLKKFGYSILDKEEGSSRKTAELMKMHHNYDYIFVSSEMCKEYLAEAYQCSTNIMKVFPLPRLDILIKSSEKQKNKENIMKEYPRLAEKKTILYAPTFRKHESQEKAIQNLIDTIDLQKYNFVLKYHPILQTAFTNDAVIVDSLFSSLQWMSVSDYVITDYSAITYEAAVAGKPLFFYAYDLEQYEKERSFYVDYKKEMPGVISTSPKRIAEAILHEEYNLKEVEMFADKYVEKASDYTKNAARFILGEL